MFASIITIIAATIAAVASLVNIYLTAFFNRRIEREKWLRSDGRPLFAHFLALSNEYFDLMRDRADLMDAMRHQREQGKDVAPDQQTAFNTNEKEDHRLWKELEQAYAEIELSAPEPIVRAAHDMMASGHVMLQFRLRGEEPPSNKRLCKAWSQSSSSWLQPTVTPCERL